MEKISNILNEEAIKSYSFKNNLTNNFILLKII